MWRGRRRVKEENKEEEEGEGGEGGGAGGRWRRREGGRGEGGGGEGGRITLRRYKNLTWFSDGTENKAYVLLFCFYYGHWPIIYLMPQKR